MAEGCFCWLLKADRQELFHIDQRLAISFRLKDIFPNLAEGCLLTAES